MNHQNGYKKSLDIAKSSTYPPIEEEIIMDEEKAREFDWELFFQDLLQVKRISEKKIEVPLDDFQNISSSEITNLEPKKLYE